MRVRAWQRASEISADRVGLLVCGSIEAAAQAVFKAASGIVAHGVVVSPQNLAAQWRRLVDEVIDEGQRDLWQVSHPFPPLRMQAMLSFWDACQSATPSVLEAANQEVDRMLAMMDPSGADGALRDPVLSAFFFWGGLYVALADLSIHPEERRRLQSIAPPDVAFMDALRNGLEQPTLCLQRFSKANEMRRQKLTAVELHRILYGLIDVASADGHVTPEEMRRLREVAQLLGVSSAACDVIVAQYEEEVQRAD